MRYFPKIMLFEGDVIRYDTKRVEIKERPEGLVSDRFLVQTRDGTEEWHMDRFEDETAGCRNISIIR